MAVYTDINEEELAHFLTQYDIGALLSYRGIAEGVENSNYLLHTTRANYILTLYEKRVAPQDLPYFLLLMQHLAQKGISCPEPIIGRQGEMISELAGRPAAMVSFLEGMWMRKPTATHCREVGYGLAKLHLAGLDFPMSRPNTLSVQNWRPLWGHVKHRADELEKGLFNDIEQELEFLEQNWPKTLPQGVIHADLFADNVFFLDNKLSGIIDFYFACNDFLAYDLAICLNAWCFERDFSYNLTKGQGMLQRYQTARALSADETAAMPILARGAAMRFFLTRLYDWFNTPQNSLVTKKDPLEYLRRLRFFSGISAPSELGL